MTAPSPDKKSAAKSQRRRSYNTGITADAVLTVAFGLSREHGVEGWSLRQLLGELDTSFSVVYRLVGDRDALSARSEEHTSELQSLMRISYAVFCLKKKKTNKRIQ